MSRAQGGISALSKGLLFHGNIRVLAITSLITGLYVSMLNTILQPFVVQGLGFSFVVLGILQSVGSRPIGLASSIVQPFAGHFADLVGRKLLIVAGSAVAICSMVSFLAAALTHALVPLAVGYVLLGLSLLGYPASQAMIAETAQMDSKKMDVAFSLVFFFTQLPGALAAVAGGFIADSIGYYVVFVLAIFLESTNLLVLITFLKETGRNGNQQRKSFSFRQAVTLPPGFLRLFAPFAMDAFSYGIGGSIIYGMWVKTFGFTNSDLGLVVGTISISIVITQYPATRLLRVIGPRRSLAFAEFLFVLVIIGWLLSHSLSVYILLAVLFGVSVAAWLPALQSFFMSAAPSEERGGIAGKLAAFRGLVAVPAPIIGGYLFNIYGYYLPVTLCLIGESITTVALLKLLPSGKKPQ